MSKDENYHSEVADTFLARRGGQLFLSPMDWYVIDGWQKEGIPLHVVVRAMNDIFDALPVRRRRAVKGVLYCQEEIEARFDDWLAGQVGASTCDARIV